MARLGADQDRSASVCKHVQGATIILHLGAGFTLSQTLRVTGMSKPTAHASHRTMWAVAKKPGIAVLTMFHVLKHRSTTARNRTGSGHSRFPSRPRFAPRRCDVAGLYVKPPDHAVVISVEAKTRIQALGQTRKPLSMKPGRPEARTQCHKRNGTTCLMAAVDVATAKVTGQVHEHHRSAEFLAFLDRVAAGVETCTEHHSTTTPMRPARSAGASSPEISWRPGERDTSGCRNRHREKEQNHWAAGGLEVWKTINFPIWRSRRRKLRASFSNLACI